MSTNTAPDAGIPIQIEPRNQSVQTFQQDLHAAGGSVVSFAEPAPQIGTSDISLAMRQFYQVPERQAG